MGEMRGTEAFCSFDEYRGFTWNLMNQKNVHSIWILLSGGCLDICFVFLSEELQKSGF